MFEHRKYFHTCLEVQLSPIQEKEHRTPLLLFMTGTLLSKPFIFSATDSKQLVALHNPLCHNMEGCSSPHSNTTTVRQSSDIVQGKVDLKVEYSKVSRFMKSEDGSARLRLFCFLMRIVSCLALKSHFKTTT